MNVAKNRSSSTYQEDRKKLIDNSISALNTKDRTKRLQAVKRLGKIWDTRVVETLVQVLKDEDLEMRESAIRGLYHNRDKKAVIPLIEILQDQNDNLNIRYRAALAIREINDRTAIEPLIKILQNKDEDKNVRILVANVLENIRYQNTLHIFQNNDENMKDERMTKSFIKILQDQNENQDLRSKVVTDLSKPSNKQAIYLLKQALQDTNQNVRINAAESLYQIGYYETMNSSKETSIEKNPDQMVIEFVENKKVIEHLIQKLTDEDPKVRAYSAKAIEEYGKQAVDPLIHTLKDKDPKIRVNSMELLQKIENRRAIEPLIQTLKDEDREVRAKGAKALGKVGVTTYTNITDCNIVVGFRKNWTIGDSRAVEPLIQALKDEDPEVRANSAKTLGIIGNEEAIEPLIQISKDNNPDIRYIALKSLKLLTENNSYEDNLPLKTRESEKNVLNGLTKESVELIVSLLKDDNENVQSIVINLLRKIEIPAIEPLIRLQKNGDDTIRNNALNTINLIKEREKEYLDNEQLRKIANAIHSKKSVFVGC